MSGEESPIAMTDNLCGGFCLLTRALVEQVLLLLCDHLPKGLKLKPACLVRPDEFPCHESAFAGDEHRFPHGFGQELRMAAPVHCYEPPDRLVHSLPDR